MMKRRSFLSTVGGAVGGGVLASQVTADRNAAGAEDAVAGLPRRPVGPDGDKISVVAFPGLALRHHDQAESTAGIHRAFESGVNHFDVAPAYGNDGECEIKMGVGMQDLPRDEIFLSCKTKRRDKEGARFELERSLERLKTDHFDLYQLHCLITPEEVEQAFGPDGAMETIFEAQKEGKVRLIGFSAHTTPSALQAMKRFQFDTVMFPINFVEYMTIGFGMRVLKLAEEQGTSVLSIKPLSRGRWPKDMERTRRWWYRSMETPHEVSLAMRFVLSLPQVKTGIPPSFLDLLDKSVEACKSYEPIDDAGWEELRAVAKSSESLFWHREIEVVHHEPGGGCPYAESPHEVDVV